MSGTVLREKTLGLSEAEAAARLLRDGPNEVAEERAPRPLARFLLQLTAPLTAILLVAGVLSMTVLGQVVEGIGILVIVVLNGVLAAVEEARADRAITALRDLTAPTATVERDGRIRRLPAAELVVGDLVMLRAGDAVPADVRLVELSSLAVDEAMLTGESLPAEKDLDETAFAGTVVVRGGGRGVVVAVGGQSAVGRLAASLGRSPRTPLQRELGDVARKLGLAAALIGLALVAALWWNDPGAWQLALLAGVAIAVAAVPEGLPAVVTGALALGAHRMARRGAIARRLESVETLGSTSVLCTDKTGTLTTGKLAVVAAEPAPGVLPDELWLAAARANEADRTPSGWTGDPVDVALKEGAHRTLDREPVLGDLLGTEPFDASTRRMAAVHRTADGTVLTVKGAPEAVLPLCAPAPGLSAEIDRMTGAGLRVLVLAEGHSAVGFEPDWQRFTVESFPLRTLGVIGLADPLRESAVGTIAELRRAGIRVVLVTGDHPETAAVIAGQAGIDRDRVVTGAELAGHTDRAAALVEADVVARVDPETKLALVEAHRAAGAVVAMTGDGVNDAPALRTAHVGVALAGSGGTDVARQAAALVVTDDDLRTVVDAVREGRRIYRNIRTVVSYLITANVKLVATVLAMMALVPAVGVPLLPVQILWLNFMTEGPPAVALGVDRAPGDPLADPPRRAGERLLSARRLLALVMGGLKVAAAMVAVGLVAAWWGFSAEEIRTELLVTSAITQLLLVFAVRAHRWPFERGWTRNHALLLTVAGTALLQVLVLTVPVLRDALGLVPMGRDGIALAVGGAVTALLLYSVSNRLAAHWGWSR
ncbi:cation-translocating P-type ATPase [Allokutzneria albata]|uniref:Ca2+-transporting ATPase n=1 Tax=Allokutzneria albata TaxID=211114 RepID=A0A1G9SJV6_ALLAB|nr:cation-transporting P-type ATPase [Allokutzneria albata]SDM35709.1 Ca2+-transporting ATPase [Allokutzneria albata]